jgi:hypothetical protein
MTWSVLGTAIGAAAWAVDELPAMILGGTAVPGLMVGLVVGGLVGTFAQKAM